MGVGAKAVDENGDAIFDEVCCCFDGGAPVDDELEGDADGKDCDCFEGEGFPRPNLMPKPFPRGVL